MDVKKTYQTLILTLILIISHAVVVYALPEGESVVSGSATFDRSQADTLNVNTPSDKLIVNYNSFSIAQTETVNFNQPSSSSTVLNRVVGGDPSSIFGTLKANGRVFLINTNGIIFGKDSRVDVAALAASTLDISNTDFLNGNYNFYKNGDGSYIINQGNIVIKNGGYACLLSQSVQNEGIIQAELGTVVLASGQKLTLALDDLNDISVVIDEGVKNEVFGPDGEKLDSAVKNSGTISADGGKVILTAKVLNKVFDYSINNTGIVQAKSLVNNNGVVELVAEGAPIYNIGKVEAGEVRVETKQADVINKGEIIADKIEIKAEEAEVINIGKMVANGTPEQPDGGKIVIEAATIVQQGQISANAEEGGTAGEVIIVSQNQTILDSGSTTEARALGIVGNGGRILIDSTGGNTVVNKNAVIDVSMVALLRGESPLQLNSPIIPLKSLQLFLSQTRQIIRLKGLLLSWVLVSYLTNKLP